MKRIQMKNILPSKTSLHYLKLGISEEYIFSLEEIEEFEIELHRIADQILLFGLNIENYPIGQIEDRFNSKKQACLREVKRRNCLNAYEANN